VREEVVVEGLLGEKPAEADLAEVVDDATELVDGVVEPVLVLVEQCEEQLLATLSV
jgi:hypothetical protein